MEENYSIESGLVTVGEFKELIKDLPDDYILTCCGVDEFYINVLATQRAVTIDTENDYVEWYEEE